MRRFCRDGALYKNDLRDRADGCGGFFVKIFRGAGFKAERTCPFPTGFAKAVAPPYRKYPPLRSTKIHAVSVTALSSVVAAMTPAESVPSCPMCLAML